MSMSDYDKKNVGKIIRGHGDWFTANLFRLICVADDKNRAKLFKAFPHEVDVVQEYKTGKPYIYSKEHRILCGQGTSGIHLEHK